MSWLARLIDLLFGCSHERTTFPMTRRREPGRPRGMSVCCLACGKEFDYDWRKMRIGGAVESSPLSPSVVTEEQSA